MRPRRLIVAILLLLAAAGCGGGTTTAAQQVTSYHGLEPAPVPTRPQFVLQDTGGATYDFRARTGGRPTFVYFGYTHCPDECPTAMADLAAALRKAPTPQAVVVFVTTDPRRDTAPVLRRWLDQFSSTFVGLLGSTAQIDAAQRAVGVQVAAPGPPVPTVPGHPDQHVHAPGTAPHRHLGPLGYSVTHSAVIFAYDAADRLPVLYPGGATPSDIAADLPVLADPAPPRSTP